MLTLDLHNGGLLVRKADLAFFVKADLLEVLNEPVKMSVAAPGSRSRNVLGVIHAWLQNDCLRPDIG